MPQFAKLFAGIPAATIQNRAISHNFAASGPVSSLASYLACHRSGSGNVETSFAGCLAMSRAGNWSWSWVMGISLGVNHRVRDQPQGSHVPISHSLCRLRAYPLFEFSSLTARCGFSFPSWPSLPGSLGQSCHHFQARPIHWLMHWTCSASRRSPLTLPTFLSS